MITDRSNACNKMWTSVVLKIKHDAKYVEEEWILHRKM